MSIPIIGGGGAVSGTGVTLAALRNRLADEFGHLMPTTVSTTATQGDLTRVVLADELRDDEPGYQSVAAQWLYVRSGAQAGTQRRIIFGDPGHPSQMGAVVLSRPLSSAPSAGSVIDVTSPLPMKRHGGVKGLEESLIEGLARIWVEARIALTGNGTRSQSLAAYPWLTRYDQIRGIYDTVDVVDGVPELAYRPIRLVTNGVDRTLILDQSYDTGTTYYLAVIVRADTLVYDGSTWSYVTSLSGVNDTYQFAVPEEWAVAFGMVMALRYLDRLVRMRNGVAVEDRTAALDDIARRRRQWARSALSIKLREMPRPLPEPRDSIVSVPRVVNWP